MLAEGIKSILSYSELKTEIKCVDSIKKAYKLIFEDKTVNHFDLISLDISMPPFIERNLKNGIDLAEIIRKNYPKIKIIILTGGCNDDDISMIIRKINPNGFIQKSDLNAENIDFIFNQIIKNKHYTSLNILEQKENIKKNIQLLDSTNLEIIQLLSKGFSTKSISQKPPLSLSAIKKRKKKIKLILEIDSGNDEEIIKIAQLKKII